jgi:DNA-binding PadR family transcriptional regulator
MDEHDERILLLLGLLMAQSQHGYQINEFIEQNLARVSQMRKATAYALLTRLAETGLVEASMEQAGNRPARRVYAITPTGEQRFRSLLEAILANPVMSEPPGDIALMFVDHLSREQALAAISRRLETLDAEIATLAAAPGHGAGIGVDLAINRRLSLLRADRDWFAAAAAEVRSRLPETSSLAGHPHAGQE